MKKTIEIRKTSGLRRILKLVMFGIASLLVIAIGCFLNWSLNVHVAEPKAYAEALHNPQIVIRDSEGFITIRPATGKPKVGLLFYPGARVAPEAYVAKLSAIALSADVQIVIGRPLLNLAFFSINQADEMRAAVP